MIIYLYFINSSFFPLVCFSTKDFCPGLQLKKKKQVLEEAIRFIFWLFSVLKIWAILSLHCSFTLKGTTEQFMLVVLKQWQWLRTLIVLYIQQFWELYIRTSTSLIQIFQKELKIFLKFFQTCYLVARAGKSTSCYFYFYS